MKLSAREALSYFRKPDPTKAGLLIYGGDAMRVAQRRQEVIAALVGPEGEAEMRLTRIPAADLRKVPALLNDAIKAQGFFPGPRAAFVEDATDGLSKDIDAALADWRTGDAQIIVTAGQLTAKSALRKVFESSSTAYAIGIYDDPPTREEVETALTAAGLINLSHDAMDAILALSRTLEPGDFRQTVEKVGLYKRADPSPLTPDEIALSAPQSSEAQLDDLLAIVAEGRVNEIARVLSRIYAQGVNPVGLCIGATRHFRTLYAAASAPGGAAQGVANLRPPVFGPRRDAIVKQASKWGRDRLERALTELTDTDLQLRSTAKAPQQALVERTLIRLAMLGGR